jgi:phosphoribosylformimino-5-aminoimidazole carboxamide ribotide isomerase
MHIIPAIDIINGVAVRLTQGDFNQKTEYNYDPLQLAKEFEAAGLKRLHIVDLDGARQKKIVNADVLKKISRGTKLAVDFGGGVQSDADIKLAFDMGAEQITAGSIAIKNPEMVKRWINTYGPDKIILGADVRGHEIAVSGWQEGSGQDIIPFIERYFDLGIRYIICTDISKDGMLQGPATELYQEMKLKFPELNIIASGGVSSMEDVQELKAVGCWGCIIGKAIYENKVTVEELAEFDSRYRQ